MYQDGFLDPLSGAVMGETAETLAVRDGIARTEQDEYALESQCRAAQAWDEGAFAAEVVAVAARDPAGKEILVERDEHPRAGTTLDKLAKLPPVFRADGTVTAGNSSGITDGAAALVLMDEEYARAHAHPILARLGAHAQVGVDPAIMGIGPVPAFRRVFEATGLGPKDFDLVEINEAFAAQVLACLRELPFDRARVNVHGGAIALGHPIGASGARIVTTLVHALQRRGLRRGAASLCISGGQGMALVVERV
jgi:acetyl-CoA acetyltransferase family protein